MTPNSLLGLASAAVSGVLAIGVAFRAYRSMARWTFCAGMFIFALERLCSALSGSATSPEDMLAWENRRFELLACLPGFWLLFSLTYARGAAREFLQKWRWILLGAFFLPVIMVALAAVNGSGSAVVPLPQGAGYFIRLGWWGMTIQLFLLMAVILVLVNLERTLRASVGTVRWRIKFMILGLGVLFTVKLYTSSQALLYHGVAGIHDSLNSGALIAACLLVVRSLLRTGHFELDVYPSQSILHGSLTVILAGIYLFAVGVLAKVVVSLGGVSSFPLQSLLVLGFLVLLALLLQSDRVQLQLRRMVSRHFQRPIYDYRTVWRKFTEGTTSKIESAEFCHAVAKLLSEIFQTLSVTLWLVDDHHEEITLAASTSVSDLRARESILGGAETIAVLKHLRAQTEPVDFEHIQEEWAAALRHCHPNDFDKGGTRVCVPIRSGDEVLALIILGDRVGGAAFTVQDLDLLKSIGGHIAFGLLNVRLSQRLLQVREHEAFHAMATFFVHDLKNAATTLNLLLKNLPAHFEDPAFREDALRGVGKSVAHINHLISRLSELRHELKIQSRESDLNEIVTGVLAGLGNDSNLRIERDLAPKLSGVLVDRDQIVKVVTNLVLNARDAMGGSGRIGISTRESDEWVTLAVADQGCGMTKEFVARSLFRPFQTTKKSGLGIGLFHCKMIIEAHGGRITVESTLGQGTTFRVLLPRGGEHRGVA